MSPEYERTEEMKTYQYNEDPCENCYVELGVIIQEGVFVCKRCQRELKKQVRKAENRRRKKEEREELEFFKRGI